MSQHHRGKGRPRALTIGKSEQAKKLFIEGQPISKIVESLEISRATFYRYQETWKVPFLEVGIVDFFRASVGYYNRFPTGRHPGHFDLQVAKLIAEDLKLRIRFKPVPLHRLFSGIDDGIFSVGLGNIGSSNGRKLRYGISEPYSNFSGKPMGALIARRSVQAGLSNPKSLVNLKIATSTSSLSHDWLNQQNVSEGSLQIAPFAFSGDALKALCAGQVDAVMDSYSHLSHFLAQESQFEIKGPVVDFGNTTICLLHDRGDERMLNLVSESIVRLRRRFLLESLIERTNTARSVIEESIHHRNLISTKIF